MYESLQGGDKQTKALVWQWLEDRIQTDNDTLPVLVKKLNDHLLNQVYVVQNQLTIVDFVLFLALKSYLMSLSQLEKQTHYYNVARWSAFIQGHGKKSRKNQFAIVMKNNYYN